MEKRDKTRLRNLLNKYRDHFITVYYDKFGVGGFPHYSLGEVIDKINHAIERIMEAME